MIIDKQKLKKELELFPLGQKGWMKNKGFCPFCGKSKDWGIIFADEGGIFNCFKGKCSTKTSIFNYLKQIGREDLIEYSHTPSLKTPLTSLKEYCDNVDNIINISHKRVQGLPHRFKIIDNDDYLNNRNFTKKHYEIFKPGYTNSLLEKKLHDYIIFQIFQNGELDCWVARSRRPKSWHEENLIKANLGLEPLVLRYINSENTDFGNILGGIDEITENTEMVILVEGIFDKVGVDTKLNLFESESVRCCFSFGNKVTNNQIEVLKSKKNIKFVILFFDYGTILQLKKCGMMLSKYFSTYIAVCESNNDPGDMLVSEMNRILDNLQTVHDFYLNNLNYSL